MFFFRLAEAKKGVIASHYSIKYWPVFTFFARLLSNELGTEVSWKILQHLKRVATLPCRIFMPEHLRCCTRVGSCWKANSSTVCRNIARSYCNFTQSFLLRKIILMFSTYKLCVTFLALSVSICRWYFWILKLCSIIGNVSAYLRCHICFHAPRILQSPKDTCSSFPSLATKLSAPSYSVLTVFGNIRPL